MYDTIFNSLAFICILGFSQLLMSILTAATNAIQQRQKVAGNKKK